MPAGCDFTCRNDQCKQTGKGFVMTAPWPMTNIDNVLNSRRVKELPDLKDQLQKIKKSGRENACITFPNVDDAPISVHRIQYWHPVKNCIWQYELDSKGENIGSAIKKAKVPSQCPLGDDVMSFKEVLREGVKCPHCKEKMSQARWFAKEI